MRTGATRCGHELISVCKKHADEKSTFKLSVAFADPCLVCDLGRFQRLPCLKCSLSCFKLIKIEACNPATMPVQASCLFNVNTSDASQSSKQETSRAYPRLR